MVTLNEAIIYLPDNAQFEWNNYSAHEQMAGSPEIIYTWASNCLDRNNHFSRNQRLKETIISLQINLTKLKFNG